MPSKDNPVMAFKWQLRNLDDCRAMAQWLAEQVAKQSPTILPLALGLVGPLGAGKTQWTKFFAQSLGVYPDDVSSPTYVLIHRYESNPPIYHVDAYRVHDEDEFLELGIEELFEEPHMTIVQWANRFRNLMPDRTIWITFELDPNDPSGRTATIECGKKGPRLEPPPFCR